MAGAEPPHPPPQDRGENDMTDTPKKKNRGPKRLAPEDKRGHTVSAMLNPAELATLDERRARVHMQRGQYLRTAALDRLPQSIPKPNRQAWLKLAGPAANLNQIAKHLNESRKGGDGTITAEMGAHLAAQLTECRRLITLLRNDLIGVSHGEADDES